MMTSFGRLHLDVRTSRHLCLVSGVKLKHMLGHKVPLMTKYSSEKCDVEIKSCFFPLRGVQDPKGPV